MKLLSSRIPVFLACSALLLSTSVLAQHAQLTEDEAEQLGTAAYIYGYPLVTMDQTRRVMTNVARPEGARAPMGQFANLKRYPTATFKDVTTPNADTLYSIAWLDLAKEPYILHVPNEEGRYYLMPMLDGWTTVFASPGTRTTGANQAHNFAIIGPHWKGDLPKNVTPYHSLTNMVWIIGRTYSTGTPEDYKAVNAIQDQYSLTPLSAYGKTYTPPAGKVDPDIDMKTSVRDQVNAMDAKTFFSKLASLLKDNPPAPTDAPMLAKLKKLGIVPGQPFDFNQLGLVAGKGLSDAVRAGQQKIVAHAASTGVNKNGWIYSTKTGKYGTNYLQRAYIAMYGLGANLPQDAIYPMTSVDRDGNPLSGEHNYRIHFGKGEMPPVKGFWSLTMYNKQYFFVENPLKRYTLSQRDHLKKNPDGSVDLYIQHQSPGKADESNWLPAPEGPFVLVFRFYWPKEAIINGSWNPPPVKRVESKKS